MIPENEMRDTVSAAVRGAIAEAKEQRLMHEQGIEMAIYAGFDALIDGIYGGQWARAAAAHQRDQQG